MKRLELVFLLEEPSIREVLNIILPKFLPPEIPFLLIPHEGKRDLERSIPRKLRAWQNPHARFVIVRDKDSADCLSVKQRLTALCEQVGRRDCLIRIVCHELEAWFLGDLQAIERAFELKRLSRQAGQEKFRQPDLIANATEELKKLVGSYQKIGGARTIAPYLELERNRSHSFQVFIDGVRRLADEMINQQ
jgi:hypothetical protein